MGCCYWAFRFGRIDEPVDSTNRQRTPLRDAAPFFDRSPNDDRNVNLLDSANMGGVEYRDVLRFGRTHGFALNALRGGGTNFSLHNLWKLL